MDLIRKRQASTLQARTSFAGVLTAYLLFALFTSLPLQTTARSLSAPAPLALATSLPAPSSSPLKQPADRGKWWQQHQEMAYLHEKWWQRHSLASAGADPMALAPKPITPRQTAIAANNQAATLQLTKSENRPALVAAPTIALAGVSALSLIKPLALAKISQSAQNILADRAEYANADLEAELPAFSKRAFEYREKRPLREQYSAKPPKAAQCVADNIAGWSGLTLSPRQQELLKKPRPPSSQISLELAARLDLKGFTPGSSIFIRIFKDRSELEVWLKKGERYALYHTYKICRWSGSFGPKLYEGDKQSPEGFYTVNKQLFTRPSWKWKGSFSIGYPNAYDKLHGRTGSLILVHGGCTSSGCFAMTDPVIGEVRELAQQARDAGQQKFNVHVYPFKLTTANLVRHKDSPWLPFWNNLKEGYDLFEKTGLPPIVRVCNKRYVFAANGSDQASVEGADKGCYGLTAAIPGWKPASRIASKAVQTRARRAARKAKRTAARSRCKLSRASCRKYAALKRKKISKRRARLNKKKRLIRKKRLARKKHLASKKRRAAKRRATMRRAKSIGAKRKAYQFGGGQ